MCFRGFGFITCTICITFRSELCLHDVILNKFLTTEFFLWVLIKFTVHMVQYISLARQLTNCTKTKKETRQTTTTARASEKYSRVLRVGSLEGIKELMIRAATAKMPAKAWIVCDGFVCEYVCVCARARRTGQACGWEEYIKSCFALVLSRWTTRLSTHDSCGVLLRKDTGKPKCAALKQPTSHCRNTLTSYAIHTTLTNGQNYDSQLISTSVAMVKAKNPSTPAEGATVTAKRELRQTADQWSGGNSVDLHEALSTLTRDMVGINSRSNITMEKSILIWKGILWEKCRTDG